MPGPNVDRIVVRAIIGMIASLLMAMFFFGFSLGRCTAHRDAEVPLLLERPR